MAKRKVRNLTEIIKPVNVEVPTSRRSSITVRAIKNGYIISKENYSKKNGYYTEETFVKSTKQIIF